VTVVQTCALPISYHSTPIQTNTYTQTNTLLHIPNAIHQYTQSHTHTRTHTHPPSPRRPWNCPLPQARPSPAFITSLRRDNKRPRRTHSRPDALTAASASHTQTHTHTDFLPSMYTTNTHTHWFP